MTDRDYADLDDLTPEEDVYARLKRLELIIPSLSKKPFLFRQLTAAEYEACEADIAKIYEALGERNVRDDKAKLKHEREQREARAAHARAQKSLPKDQRTEFEENEYQSPNFNPIVDLPSEKAMRFAKLIIMASEKPNLTDKHLKRILGLPWIELMAVGTAVFTLVVGQSGYNIEEREATFPDGATEKGEDSAESGDGHPVVAAAASDH
jgi:hypothetical protein